MYSANIENTYHRQKVYKISPGLSIERTGLDQYFAVSRERFSGYVYTSLVLLKRKAVKEFQMWKHNYFKAKGIIFFKLFLQIVCISRSFRETFIRNWHTLGTKMQIFYIKQEIYKPYKHLAQVHYAIYTTNPWFIISATEKWSKKIKNKVKLLTSYSQFYGEQEMLFLKPLCQSALSLHSLPSLTWHQLHYSSPPLMLFWTSSEPRSFHKNKWKLQQKIQSLS